MDKNSLAVALFNRKATDYQGKYMDVSLYHETLDRFCECLPKEGATLLEIACGPGNITRYLLEKRPNLQITGTDLAPNMVELAKKNNPNAEFRVMDGRNITALSKNYQGVICGFGFPYFSKEEALQFIADAAMVLEQHGILYLSTMEDAYEKSGWQRSSSGEELYQYYHEAGYLVKAMEENGFTVVELKRIEYLSPQGNRTVDLVIIARKQFRPL